MNWVIPNELGDGDKLLVGLMTQEAWDAKRAEEEKQRRREREEGERRTYEALKRKYEK